ncbi:MAG: RNA-binding S4 domain-containing protein [Verrucomicrobia bacterium]|nr:RNA-binding S4 domain-containing protein [Verrucomicrobiota bacterium]
MESVRMDKWLWSVRIYKTRTAAAKACQGGKVTVDGSSVKPSRAVKTDEVIQAKVGSVTKKVKVLGIIDRRVGAPEAREYAEDLTSVAEYQKARERRRHPGFHRPKGTGRPTKKDRRELEKFFSFMPRHWK